MLGVIAVLALGIYAIYFFALIKLIPITLTLPGIAGLILTIGVAADANIVIFERVKEEIRHGRSISAGIAQGYKKGFATIVDANIVTLLVAFILFILATAGVKGFAFVLGVGTMVSLFTAVLATQAILLTLRGSRLLQSPTRARRGQEAQADHVRLHGRVEVVLLDVRPDPADLHAGDRLQGPELRHRLRVGHADHGVAGEGRHGRAGPRRGHAGRASATPRSRRSTTRSSARTSSRSPTRCRARPTQVTEALDKAFGVRGQPEVSEIGPTFGETVANSALIAIIASLLVISIYIALRFEWKFAVPVLIALMHDILITAGVYALVGREVTTSTVAALLTILGFSLYDTIIVFDRIRENVPRMPSAAFSQIVNRSMSEVIVRSLATSFCTMLPVLALFFFGGETLKDFAFALLIGTLSGTYSSVFIAGPVLVHWKESEPVYASRYRRIREALGLRARPYAVATAGAPVDVEPSDKRRAARLDHRAAGSDAGLARGVRRHGPQPRDRGGDEPARSLRRPRPGGPTGGRRARSRAAGGKGGAGARPAGDGGTQPPEGEGDRQAAEEAAEPAAREASLMGALVWVMMGLALWHFTIFVPDRFWSGIVGAFLGAVIGSLLFGLIINGFSVPGQNDTDLLTALEAIPGTLIGLAAVYFYGAKQGNEPL